MHRLMGLLTSTLIVALIVALAGVLGGSSDLTAAQADSTKVDSTSGETWKDDGPHVYWSDDTTAVVLYFSDGKFVRETLSADSPRSFVGLLWDDTITYKLHSKRAEAKPAVVSGASRIFALSDIHGEYEYLVQILQTHKIIDSARHWIWGDGHLVVNGDIFDRGDKITECLWLIYLLEAEAENAGGAVHYILGNHELMVLRNDLRYVSDKYLKGISRRNRINNSDLFGEDMELGRWLRTKQTMLVINDILFVHGGVSPELIDSAYSMSEVNSLMQSLLDAPAQELMFDFRSKFLTGSFGPLWYRGFHYEMEGRYPRATSEGIDRILEIFSAGAVVVGHTGVDTISSLYDKRVFAIDVDFDELQALEGLLWNKNGFHRATGEGELILIR